MYSSTPRAPYRRDTPLLSAVRWLLSQASACLGHWYDVRLNPYWIVFNPGEVPKDSLRFEVCPPFVMILAQDTQRAGIWPRNKSFKEIFAVGRSSKVVHNLLRVDISFYKGPRGWTPSHG